MGRKALYIVELMEQPIDYSEEVIAAVKHFKSLNLKLRNLPEEERLQKQMVILADLNCDLCKAYNIKTVELRFGGGYAHFNSAANRICLGGKFSIITYLHEFAHAMRSNLGISANNRNEEEKAARHWSVLLFKTVFPIAYENLDVSPESTGPHDFLLVRPTR